MFQSPRTGKFESNGCGWEEEFTAEEAGFNPLERGNLNQIRVRKGELTSWDNVSIP